MRYNSAFQAKWSTSRSTASVLKKLKGIGFDPCRKGAAAFLGVFSGLPLRPSPAIILFTNKIFRKLPKMATRKYSMPHNITKPNIQTNNQKSNTLHEVEKTTRKLKMREKKNSVQNRRKEGINMKRRIGLSKNLVGPPNRRSAVPPQPLPDKDVLFVIEEEDNEAFPEVAEPVLVTAKAAPLAPTAPRSSTVHLEESKKRSKKTEFQKQQVPVIESTESIAQEKEPNQQVKSDPVQVCSSLSASAALPAKTSRLNSLMIKAADFEKSEYFKHGFMLPTCTSALAACLLKEN
jgi:hypothetical protein